MAVPGNGGGGPVGTGDDRTTIYRSGDGDHSDESATAGVMDTYVVRVMRLPSMSGLRGVAESVSTGERFNFGSGAELIRFIGGQHEG